MMNNRKLIAWGSSKLLKIYLARSEVNPFCYCIDDFSGQSDVLGLPIKKSECLRMEAPGSFKIVIFAVSNRSLQEISRKLNAKGLSYRTDFIFYSDFFYAGFVAKAEKTLGLKFDPRLYGFALSYTLNSRVLIHTTILGTWLFLEILRSLDAVEDGQIAEVGAFQGGNALCGLNFMVSVKERRFYIFDSFEGFPELSINDPGNFSKGDYNVETSFQEIIDCFAPFPHARIVKGFVPESFSQVPESEKFSLVFYDCDLYQPALDTFEFFWDRIVPGGYLVVHDYETEEGGFTGVRKAVDEFFRGGDVNISSFFENTMAVLRK